MSSPFTSVTNAAKLSHTVQSALISSQSKSKHKTEHNYKLMISLLSSGCLIGFTLNHIYHKYYEHDPYESESEDDLNIDDYHKQIVSELKRSKSSMYTLPPHYALKCYQSKHEDNRSVISNKTKPTLTKSLSAALFTSNKKKKKKKKDIFDIYQEKQQILNEIKCQLLKYEHCAQRKLLFLSNESQNGYQQIKRFLGIDTNHKVLLIPFGHDDWEKHSNYIEQKMWEIGKKCVSIHSRRNMWKLIGDCDAILICGGNPYKLLYYLYHYNLMAIVQRVINDGVPYIAIGSGVSCACRTIQTCFDLPVIQPPTFKSLSVIPFQLIPRFDEFDNERYDKQIRLFIKENKNQKVAVLGLCKECFISIENNTIRLLGTGNGAVLYRDDVSEREEIAVGGLLSSLLQKHTDLFLGLP